jgi:signal transduction histidine kinase
VTPRRLAAVIFCASSGFGILWMALDIAEPVKGRSGLGDYVLTLVAILLYATVGYLITSRGFGNRVGLIFSWIGLSAAVGLTFGAYAKLAVARALPFVAATTWVANVGFVVMIGPLAFLFLIFPSGSPPSRRWGWVLRAMVAAYAITVVLFALTPGRMQAGFADYGSRVQNPIALPAAWGRTIEILTQVAGAVVAAGAVLSILSLIQRYRRAEAAERRQIRSLAFLGAFIAVYFVLMLGLQTVGVLPEEGPVINATFIVLVALIFVGIPITCAVAILKHGLWDLDVVIKKTVQYGVLVVLFTAVIGIVLLLAPAVVVGVRTDGGGIGPGFVLGIVITIAFVLLRARARRLANRIVYGKRASPYEVLSEFAERIGETYSTEDVLPRMSQLLGEATGAREARVWLRVGDTIRAEASWPSDAPSIDDRAMRGDGLPDFEGAVAFEVRHQGELLGALTVTEAPDDPMNPTKDKLARDMAAQAGLVLRNVALIEDLRESRRRIVSAQDERARTLERNIHDGAQQQLVALSVKLRLADGLVDRDPTKVHELLVELQSQTTETLEDLRDLARGIYPPLLADQGLPAALEAQARRSPTPITIEPDGVGRYGPDVESAVYFSCLEALNNVAKYAHASRASVRLSQDDGWLSFEVEDDGRGFEVTRRSYGTGLQGVADRLAALGGEVTVRSAPGDGTTVAGRLPVGTT